MTSNAIARAVHEFARVFLACTGFVLFEKAANDWCAGLPEEWRWIASLIAVAIGSAASMVVFFFLTPFTTVSLTWLDAATNVSATGPVLDIAALGAPGQIIAVRADRVTGRGIGGWIFRGLMREGVSIIFESNQSQLKLNVQNITSYAAADQGRIAIKLGEARHSTNSVPFDLGVRWDQITTAELTGKLTYSVHSGGRLPTRAIARLIIRIEPTITEIRKVQGNV